MNNFLTTLELNNIARWLYESTYYESFYGKVNWGSKMLGIAGNCNSNGQIMLNKNYYLNYGKEEVLLVLRHELAHLYCFRHFGTHSDDDECFILSLQKINGIKKAKSIPKEFYIYTCKCCGKQWFFTNKIQEKQFCKDCFELYNKKEQKSIVEVKKTICKQKEDRPKAVLCGISIIYQSISQADP